MSKKDRSKRFRGYLLTSYSGWDSMKMKPTKNLDLFEYDFEMTTAAARIIGRKI